MTPLTIQTDPELVQALEERAENLGTSVSSVANDILREALEERPLANRVGHLKGRLELPEDPTDPFSKTIREHNWRS